MESTEVLVAAAMLCWVGSGVWLAVTDLRTGLLPTRVIWPTAAVVWVLFSSASLIGAHSGALIAALVGAGLCGALLASVHVVHPPSMGFGDVRLSVLNGLVCGWWGWQTALVGLLAGFVVAFPEAVYVLIRHGARASRPLGPYLVAGAVLVVGWSVATAGLAAPLR